MSKLVCPECKTKFSKVSVDVEKHTVHCPNPDCGHVMFEYLRPDEKINRAAFRGLITTDRGAAAGVAAAKWMTVKGSRMRALHGSLFVAWMWPNLAGTIDE